MKILITGGAGFIGSNLADCLLRDPSNSVVVIDNFSDFYNPELKRANVAAHLENPRYRLCEIDIENSHELEDAISNEKPDVIVHLAARAGIQPSLKDPMAYVKTNIIGTMNVLEAMKKNGIPKIVFASSSSVYGNCNARLFSEDLKITEPISPYAATKSACEQMIYTYHHLYGIKAACLRFFTVYGPRQRPDLAIRKFTAKIKNHQPIQMYGDGSTIRDYTFIDDIVAGIMAAIDYSATGYEIINLGGGEPTPLSKMIATISSALGTPANIEQVPMKPGDVIKTACDTSKAKRLLGYNPQTPFAVGIEKFVEWFNKSRYLQ